MQQFNTNVSKFGVPDPTFLQFIGGYAGELGKTWVRGETAWDLSFHEPCPPKTRFHRLPWPMDGEVGNCFQNPMGPLLWANSALNGKKEGAEI